MSAPIDIVAVLVLYKVALVESTSYCSFVRAASAEPTLQGHLHLIVFGNSPAPSQLPTDFAGTYHHQPENPGLAVSYNRALGSPEAANATWMTLLDQDTELTREYLDEVRAVADHYAGDRSVAGAVPKLIENGVVQSPHADLTTLRPEPLSSTFSGFPSNKLHMYNSGALLRISSLHAIGGFPTDFWLDFLDHATFHLLRKDGSRVLVMRSQLEHRLSTNAPMQAWNRSYLRRHKNVLEAELLFYKRYGSREERMWYRLRMLRLLYGALKRARLPIALQLLQTTVRSFQ